MNTQTKATGSLDRRRFLAAGAMAFTFLVGRVPRLTAATVKRPAEPVDLEFLAGKLDLVRRHQWTAVAPKPWRLRAAGQYSRITVHHAGGAVDREKSWNGVVFRLDGIRKGHVDRGYGDVGYHFVIDASGRAWEGRSLGYEGAHVSGGNRSNIGVMLLGNFEQQEPSAAQRHATGVLVDALSDRYTVKRHRVYGHRDLGPSVCPGRNLYAFVETLRTRSGT